MAKFSFSIWAIRCEIFDLAHDLIRLHGLVPDKDIPIHIIGKRPGEKMYEELLTPKELHSAEKRGPFFVAATQTIDHDKFNRQIHHLIESGQRGEEQARASTICQIVPEFPTAPKNNGPPHASGHDAHQR